MKKKRNKYALSLLEIMVVIFIIGIIGAVIGVNMKGSLEQGKAFKTEKGSKQVCDILDLELAKDPTILKETSTHKEVIGILKRSGLPHDAGKLMEDGWGAPYVVRYDAENQEFKVTSANYINYLRTKKKMKPAAICEKCPWMELTDEKKN